MRRPAAPTGSAPPGGAHAGRAADVAGSSSAGAPARHRRRPGGGAVPGAPEARRAAVLVRACGPVAGIGGAHEPDGFCGLRHGLLLGTRRWRRATAGGAGTAGRRRRPFARAAGARPGTPGARIGGRSAKTGVNVRTSELVIGDRLAEWKTAGRISARSRPRPAARHRPDRALRTATERRRGRPTPEEAAVTVEDVPEACHRGRLVDPPPTPRSGCTSGGRWPDGRAAGAPRRPRGFRAPASAGRRRRGDETARRRGRAVEIPDAAGPCVTCGTRWRGAGAGCRGR